jgi:hypothetical protein
MGKSKLLMLKNVCENCEVFLKHQKTLEVSSMPKKEQKEWIEKRLNAIKEARNQALKEKGFGELFNFPIGETEVEILLNPPREVKTKFGSRDVLAIKVNDKIYDFMINPQSPLYLKILENLYEDKRHFIIVRSGAEKSTRYDVKKVW